MIQTENKSKKLEFSQNMNEFYVNLAERSTFQWKSATVCGGKVQQSPKSLVFLETWI